jgi:serine/threonine-protein kinase
MSDHADPSTAKGRRPPSGGDVAYGADLEPGTMVGHYEIEKLASRGGFASIYLARHAAIGRQAAVKVLHKYLTGSVAMIRRFQQEAQAVNLIRHPNIVDIFEFGELPDGRPYFVMEWLEGANLAEHLEAHGRMSEPDAYNLMEDLCAALAAAHKVGVVHRDLKSSNVILVPAGDWFHVKLVDFGIAKLVSGTSAGEISALGTRLGTPWTMAPEQILGLPIDERADIYAVGVLLYEVLTGQLPYAGKTPEEVEQRHLNALVPSAAALAPVSPAVDAVIRSCLEKERERRPQTVSELIHALRRAASGPSARRERTIGAGLAVGLRVEARIDIGKTVDEALLDELDRVLIEARGACERAGLDLAIDHANALVAVQALPADPGEARALRERVLRAAVGLRARLRPGSSPVRVSIAVHVASLIRRVAGDEVDYVGGDLLCAGPWAAEQSDDGVTVTDAALDGLSEHFLHEPLEGRPGLSSVVAYRSAGSRAT